MTIHMRPGESDEWFTPPFIFEALCLEFDLDPCGPEYGGFVPARRTLTKSHDGLECDWHDWEMVYMNPPFGGRNGQVPWLKRFIEHGNGVALVNALTSSGWFHDWAVKAQTMVFPRGKTKFIRPDGSVGKSPGNGIVLLGMGERANLALRDCDLGLFVDNGAGL